MSERDFRGSWKLKPKKGKGFKEPVVGMIYTDGPTIGMLVSKVGDSGILRTKEGQEIRVQKIDLKLIGY